MGWLDEILARLDRYAGGIQTSEKVPPVVAGEWEVRPDVGRHSDLFNRAVDFVLKEEGGYVNDPRDPGGETKYGISKRAHPYVDVKNLTESKAKDIYFEEYWVPIRHIAELHPELAIAVFDTGVNMGVGTAIRLMQNTLKVKEDGIIGPATRAAIESRKDSILARFLANRINRYTTLSGWSTYKNGWVVRVIRLAMEVA